MEWPTKYKGIHQNTFQKDNYSILPIRYEDRLSIMQWRNEQIYHLRQQHSLQAADQEKYFKGTVRELFNKESPEQYLFSYIKSNECIGYGGLVHINWTDQNAEVSFIIETSMEKDFFELHWSNFLLMIEQFAFHELALHKIFVYAFDLRPHLYETLKKQGYFLDARLKEHCKVKDKFIDVVIHSKINSL